VARLVAAAAPAFAPQALAWMRAMAGLPKASSRVRDDANHLIGVFSARGVDLVLLKGIYLANRLYHGYHRRPQYDLDVLVRARSRATARRTLEGLGFRKETADLHSQTFTRGHLKIDVHGWLRRAPAYRLDEEGIWRGVRIEPLEGFDVPTLSDEYTLVLFALSCFEDLGQGMTKLKQLVDVYLWLRDVDASTNWSGFFAQREREGVDGIAAAVLAIVVALFDARHEVPRLSTALAHYERAVSTTREEALALVSAPRKHPANLAWFGRVYPGSFWHYLTRFWWAGFPQNLKGLRADRVRATLRAAGRQG